MHFWNLIVRILHSFFGSKRESISMSTVTINGKTFTAPGSSISIINGVVTIGGKVITDGLDKLSQPVSIKWEGPIANLKTDCSVNINGDVGGNVESGSSVTCGYVGGNVKAGSSVICGDVGQDVNAGSSVSCGKVSGKVSAGSSVISG